MSWGRRKRSHRRFRYVRCTAISGKKRADKDAGQPSILISFVYYSIFRPFHDSLYLGSFPVTNTLRVPLSSSEVGVFLLGVAPALKLDPVTTLPVFVLPIVAVAFATVLSWRPEAASSWPREREVGMDSRSQAKGVRDFFYSREGGLRPARPLCTSPHLVLWRYEEARVMRGGGRCSQIPGSRNQTQSVATEHSGDREHKSVHVHLFTYGPLTSRQVSGGTRASVFRYLALQKLAESQQTTSNLA